jgi:hypothetical protein
VRRRRPRRKPPSDRHSSLVTLGVANPAQANGLAPWIYTGPCQLSPPGEVGHNDCDMEVSRCRNTSHGMRRSGRHERTAPSHRDGGGASSSGAFSLPPGLGIGASISASLGTAGVRFTACMRSQGVPNFPDPDSQGTITVTVSASMNPSSPAFRRAVPACHDLIPAGSEAGHTLSQAQQQQMKARVLAFAACMRSHQVPSYPDPKFSNG